MDEYIGCDAHKLYSVFVVIDDHCRVLSERRVSHDREEFRSYWEGLPKGSEIALEAGGVWHWIVDEMLAAGHHPHLASRWKRRSEWAGRTRPIVWTPKVWLVFSGAAGYLKPGWRRGRFGISVICCGCGCRCERTAPGGSAGFTECWLTTDCRRRESAICSAPGAVV